MRHHGVLDDILWTWRQERSLVELLTPQEQNTINWANVIIDALVAYILKLKLTPYLEFI